MESYRDEKNKYALPKKSQVDYKLRAETCRDNIVEGEDLRRVQTSTLKKISTVLSKTFGPMGSNTKILAGNNDQTILSEYTKDGHNVLKHILFSNPIEMSIKAELVDITHHVEHEVGDGTTSAVILADKIFNNLLSIMQSSEDIQPYDLIRSFDKIVKSISKRIETKGKEIDLESIYDICMISTNGNEVVSKQITSLYEEYGFDVDIEITASMNNQTMTKTYDGLILSEGYSDPAYINNKVKGVSELHNPKIYAFFDPVDTPDLVSMFEKIVMTNIIAPLNDGEDMVPTVVLAPKISRDMSSMMEQFLNIMYQCSEDQRPPLLVVTDFTSETDQGVYLDIAKLCGCKYIRKYIDPELKKADEEKGLAATLDNVVDFCGEAELVVADVAKTKVVNPKDMWVEGKVGEEYSDTYNILVNFLQSELDHARENNQDSRTVGAMRARLRSLKSNMVEYVIGGISVADRDSLKDLVEDAVKSCASACKNGYGRASNFEGFVASYEEVEDRRIAANANDTVDIALTNDIELKIASAIFTAYAETIEMLYSTKLRDKDAVNVIITECMKSGIPFNLTTGSIENNVKTSIQTDIKILEAISKIVTIMVTSNQCLLQAPQLNTYN